MLRRLVCLLVAVALVFGSAFTLLADEGTVVKYEKGKLVVKIGDQEKTIALAKGAKILNAEGKPGKAKDLLKEGTKVDIKFEGDKVLEIKAK